MTGGGGHRSLGAVRADPDIHVLVRGPRLVDEGAALLGPEAVGSSERTRLIQAFVAVGVVAHIGGHASVVQRPDTDKWIHRLTTRPERTVDQDLDGVDIATH